MPRKIKILLGLVALFITLKWWFTSPSEAQLKARFVEHRAAFEQLETMFQQDAPADGTTFSVRRNLGETYFGASSRPPLSSARVQKYRVLFKELGVDSIGGSRDKFWMYVFGGGFTDTSWSIGYAFSRHKPDIIVPSVYHWQARQNKTAFAPLAGHWYLYHSH